MPKLKEVLNSEVHWQIPDWAIRDQANLRIRQLMASDAALFAPVYVTHSSIYWSDADPSLWSVLSDAPEDIRSAVRTRLETLKANLSAKYPQHAMRIASVFSVPNDDFIFWRENGLAIDIRVTGWGFANFKRAVGGPIRDVPSDSKLRNVTLSFSIDGQRRPHRIFDYMRGTAWATEETDADGFYSFGNLAPGVSIKARDKNTGIERTMPVTDDTHNIDIDITEYLTVRIEAFHDGVPLSDDAYLDYGHRTARMQLTSGVAEARLPWLEDTPCKVELNGEIQERTLAKNTVNTFRFDFITPQNPSTEVKVLVTADGIPVAEEPVLVRYRDSERRLNTDENGLAVTAFDTPDPLAEPRLLTVKVRDRQASDPLSDKNLEYHFAFDTPERVYFDAHLKVLDSDDNPVPAYPVIIDKGDGEPACQYLTDSEACVALDSVLSGNTLKVADALNTAYSQEYLLFNYQEEYIFHLPYRLQPSSGDMLLRVIEKDGKPSAGTTCILSQGDYRTLAYLDQDGEMTFGSEKFDYNKPIDVELFSNRREFPKLSFNLEPEEKEYELRECNGPTPWWKYALEILVLLVAVAGLIVNMAVWHGIFQEIPHLF